MTSAKLCPQCGKPNPLDARACWLCAAPLPTTAPTAPATATPPASDDSFLAWTIGSAVASGAMLVGILELALIGGVGLAVIGLVFCTPIVLGLAFATYRQRPGARPAPLAAPLAAPMPPSDRGGKQRSTAETIAIVVASVIGVLFLALLVVVVLIVLAFVACMIAVNGSHF